MLSKEIIERQYALTDLLPYLSKYFMLSPYFDIESNELLDEKIWVLTAVKKGKTPLEIPGFYDIFELLPKEGIWD